MRSHAQRERGKKGLKEKEEEEMEMEESKIAQLSSSFLPSHCTAQIGGPDSSGGSKWRNMRTRMP